LAEVEAQLRADPYTAFAFRAIHPGGFAESAVVTSFAAMDRMTSKDLIDTPTYREGYRDTLGYAELMFAALLDEHQITVRAGPSRFCPVRSALHRVVIDEAGQTSLGPEAAGRTDPTICARARVFNWIFRGAAVRRGG
jgi:hypothetical protein